MAERNKARRPNVGPGIFGSNRGLRPGLVGTPDQVAERIDEFEEAGVDLLLLQCSPQLEEMERFAAEVIQKGKSGSGEFKGQPTFLPETSAGLKRLK